MKIKTKYIALILGLMIFLKPATLFAATFNYVWLEKFPGFANTTDLPTLIKNLYNFGIWTVGIAAMFMLVIGGFMYMTSAGNTSKTGSAKSVITDSLLGLVAALGAFLLLYVINPDLTKINLGLVTVGVITPAAAPVGNYKAGCIDGVACLLCDNCTSITNICKNSKGVGCAANSGLAAGLRSALSGKSAQVTEGWPPTINHADRCHQNGDCADVNFTTANKSNPSTAEVVSLYTAFTNAGLHPLYENSNCADGSPLQLMYKSKGVTCKKYPTMNFPSSFHVKK